MVKRAITKLPYNHPGLERGVGALDLDRVEEAGGAPGQHPTREGELGNGVVPALVEAPRTILDALAAL